MPKSTKEFDLIVYEILISIRDNGNYKTTKEKYSTKDFEDAIEYAVNSNLVLGIAVNRNEVDGLQIDAIQDIRVTQGGLNFIENFAK